MLSVVCCIETLLHLAALGRTNCCLLRVGAGLSNLDGWVRSHGLDGRGLDYHDGLCGGGLFGCDGHDGEGGAAALDGHDRWS